jgi:hypothetical protein
MSTHGKRGRPRDDSRVRFPGGQVRPQVFVTGNQYQRLRMITRDPLLGTELGRLGFLGELIISPPRLRLDSPSRESRERWTAHLAVITGTRDRRATRSAGGPSTATPKVRIRPKPRAKPSRVDYSASSTEVILLGRPDHEFGSNRNFETCANPPRRSPEQRRMLRSS